MIRFFVSLLLITCLHLQIIESIKHKLLSIDLFIHHSDFRLFLALYLYIHDRSLLGIFYSLISSIFMTFRVAWSILRRMIDRAP